MPINSAKEGVCLKPFSNRTIAAAVALFFVLNIFDAVATLWGLKLNLIIEINPLMERLIELTPLAFLLVKVLVPLGLAVYCYLFYQNHRKVVTMALGLSLLVYTLVALLHAYWLAQYTFGRVGGN